MCPNILGAPTVTDSEYTETAFDFNLNRYNRHNPPPKGHMWTRVWRKTFLKSNNTKETLFDIAEDIKRYARHGNVA